MCPWNPASVYESDGPCAFPSGCGTPRTAQALWKNGKLKFNFFSPINFHLLSR